MAEFGTNQEYHDYGINDGMDIALCSLKGNELQYAGAYNPLWIVRDGVLRRIKADRQPIGYYRRPKSFTNHIIEVQKGDVIYLFTDGYVDQFGGEEGRKFRLDNLEKLLLSIQDQSMFDQRSSLKHALEEWRDYRKQVDDICVVGVKI